MRRLIGVILLAISAGAATLYAARSFRAPPASEEEEMTYQQQDPQEVDGAGVDDATAQNTKDTAAQPSS